MTGRAPNRPSGKVDPESKTSVSEVPSAALLGELLASSCGVVDVFQDSSNHFVVLVPVLMSDRRLLDVDL